MLSVENIVHRIGSKQILNGISTVFEPGLFHVIVGPNGSGKSTFLKIFSGEQRPTEGRVLYDGSDVFQLSKLFVAQRRAVMSQQPELHFPLTVAEVVMMGRYPHFTYRPSRRDESICREVIGKMEISPFLQRDYLTLSGGEKQRVQFARALAQLWEPPAKGSRYLLLDEPISSLDIHYQHQFLQIARQLTEEKIVLVAVLHDINLAIQYADSILFMKEGRQVAKGHPATIVTTELIKDVFNIPVVLIENPVLQKPLVVYHS
ncbi:MAG TPA: heme ABC transporter ATP-binding protein [Chitinophagaceae bacterium]|jgi:iron complex transport system ATP-binding protein